MSSELAISVEHVSKIYRIYEKPEDRLIQMATLGRVRRFREFPALSDISLRVGRGETVGIIGRNGCGKSTLLQIICGTLQPSLGSVTVNGRIAALLELGAGFNPEFTGRENVYMNGAILGFSREQMDARFDDIAAFAGIGEFIERPVKTYSSGMFVRLAFAVATAVEPDILVVDEALSVGDEAFQRKCFARIEGIKERGGTILFVSHGSQTIVQLCDRAVLLDAGEKLLDGDPKTVVGQYQRLVNLEGHAAAEARQAIRALRLEVSVSEGAEGYAEAVEIGSPIQEMPDTEALDPMAEWLDPALTSESVLEYESHGAIIHNARILTLDGREVNVLCPWRRYRYVYDVDFSINFEEIGFGMMIKNVSGLALGGATSGFEKERRLKVVQAGDRYNVEFEFQCVFTSGIYFMNAGVTNHKDTDNMYIHRILDVVSFRVMDSDVLRTGIIDINPHITIR